MLDRRGFIGVFYTVAEWIFRFMLLQILWVVFTVLGLGILGFMPATVAVFSIVRRWLMKETDFSIIPNFFHFFKSSWKSANIVGLVMALVGGFLYIDLKISQEFLKFAPLHVLLLILSFVFFVVCLYLFPVMSHYALKPLQYIKQSFLLALAQPINTLALLLWSFCAYILLIKIPVIYFFMGVPIVSLPIMWFCFMAFTKLEQKNK